MKMKIAAAMILMALPALAETPFEHCQVNLIVIECVQKYQTEHDRDQCVKSGGTSTTAERVRWCTEHGYGPK